VGGESAVELKKLWQQFDGFGHWILRGICRNFGSVHRKLVIPEFDAEPSGGGTLPALFSILPGKVNES